MQKRIIYSIARHLTPVAILLPAFVACATLAPKPGPTRVVNEPIVFEDKIVFLKPVVFKAGVEFRGTVEGRGAAARGPGATPAAAASTTTEKSLRLKPVPVPRAEPKPNPAPVRERRRRWLGGGPVAELSVLTYNVKMWNYADGRHRLRHVERLLREQKPDVVALQECGNWFYRALTRRPWLKEYYHVARPGGKARHVGGLVILSRYPVQDVETRVLTRNYRQRARHALVARIKVAERVVTVANIHLESELDMAPVRVRQIMDLRPMIADDPDTIMLGDFNFGDGEPEEGEITSGFDDIWAQLRPGESGYTWDMEKSWMARRFAYRGEQSRRLDRILVRSDRLQARDVRLFGERPIRGRRGHIFASDHFGVLGTLALYDR